MNDCGGKLGFWDIFSCIGFALFFLFFIRRSKDIGIGIGIRKLCVMISLFWGICSPCSLSAS